MLLFPHLCPHLARPTVVVPKLLLRGVPGTGIFGLHVFPWQNSDFATRSKGWSSALRLSAEIGGLWRASSRARQVLSCQGGEVRLCAAQQGKNTRMEAAFRGRPGTRGSFWCARPSQEAGKCEVPLSTSLPMRLES